MEPEGGKIRYPINMENDSTVAFAGLLWVLPVYVFSSLHLCVT